MNGFRTGAFLVIVSQLSADPVVRPLPRNFPRHPDGCRVLTTTGKSAAGRDAESGTTCARVDNRPSPHLLRSSKKKHEHRINRLRSCGEGRLKASGHQGAKPQLNAEQHARQ